MGRRLNVDHLIGRGDGRQRQRQVGEDAQPHDAAEPAAGGGCALAMCVLLARQKVFMYSTMAALSASGSVVPYSCPLLPLPGIVVS